MEKRLAVPPDSVLRMKVSRLDHPVLRSVSIDFSDGLSPDEAAVLAVVTNPSLRAARDARGLAAAQVFQARLLPNPSLSYSLDVPVGGDTSGKVSGVGVGLEWDLAGLVVRDARSRAARCQACSTDLDIAWREWQVAEAARLHVYRLFFARKRLALAEAVCKTAEQAYAILEKGVSAGVETGRHLSAAMARMQDARADRLRARAAMRAEQRALDRVLGFPGGRNVPIARDVTVPDASRIPPTADLVKDLEARRLDLMALRWGYESGKARLRAAVRSQFPRISIGLTGGRDTDSVKTVGVGVSISLPVFDRNQGRIAIARATRQQLFDEYAARLFEARADVAGIEEDIRATAARLANADRAIREQEQLAERCRAEADRGNLSIVAYYQARLDVLARKQKKVALQQRLAELGVALEIASGRWLITGDGEAPKKEGNGPRPNPEDSE